MNRAFSVSRAAAAAALYRREPSLLACSQQQKLLFHTNTISQRSAAASKKKMKKVAEKRQQLKELMDGGFQEEGDRGTSSRSHRGSFRDSSSNSSLGDRKIDANFARIQRKYKLAWFRKSPDVHRRCANFGISDEQFAEWAGKYVAAAEAEKIESLTAEKLVDRLARDGSQEFGDFIVNQFFAFLGSEAPHVVKNIEYLRKITDLRYPHEWAVMARRGARRIIMHVGPTNSGKTYHALQRLQNAQAGVYCSPLRLLAHEVYDRMTKAGISCQLVTGEEKRMADFSTGELSPIGWSAHGEPITQLTSCTMEVLPTMLMQVAVIDEIQMIADRQRGWAWTNALMNLNAREIHICGEESAVDVVKELCAKMDEEVEVRRYTRLGELTTSRKSLDDNWKNIRKGDCVVSFSRNSIFEIKKDIENATGLRCAVIYGSLPPEARVEQARLFNEPDTGYDVLVASDAVGMGLNLAIRRVVFVSMRKFDGESVRRISVSQTKQIGGRAGRFGSGADAGEVAAFSSGDTKILESSMASTPPKLTAIGLKPPVEAIETFSHQFPEMPFSQLWPMFCDIATVEDGYFLCSFQDQEKIAEAIEHLPLSVRDRYQIIYAPISMRDPVVVKCLVNYATCVAHSTKCLVSSFDRMPRKVPTNREDLLAMEQWHRAITLYAWMGTHFSAVFTEIDEALELKTLCESYINQGLEAIRAKNSADEKQRRKERNKNPDVLYNKHMRAIQDLVKPKAPAKLEATV
ncbi:RNA helicase [Coemansia sp. Benny D115]|nr:RNA helicase [Coemansia sp. Benny D115]